MGDDKPEEGFDPAKLFEMLRKSASVKAGAIMFGQAQVAYYDTLKESGMNEEEAFNMLAHTTEQIIKGIFNAIGPLAEVMIKAAAVAEFLRPGGQTSDKQVPGDG